jgi:hypothetical protein
MIKLKIDLTGKHSTFQGNSLRYYNGLLGLDLYRTRSERVPSPEQIKEGIDRFQHAYEGAENGDRVQINLRNKARKEVTDMFEKVLHFLQSVATEDDIPALLQAGFEVRRTRRKKPVIVPATG